VAYALMHLGAHFVISVPLRFPFGALARFAYTVAMRVSAEVSTLRGGPSARDARRTHTLLVALVSLVPGFGRLAYVFAEPLRTHRLLFLVPFDRVAKKMPGQIYDRVHVRPLVDWWAFPDPSAADRMGWAIATRLRQLVAHLPLLLAVAGINAALIAGGVVADSGDGDRWFMQRGVLHSLGLAQLLLGAAVALFAYSAFWRQPSSSRADMAGIFLWPAAAVWVAALAIDDYAGIHAAIGDFLEHWIDGIDGVLDALALVAYGVSAVCGLYLLRQEAFAVRASSTVLLLAVGALAFIGLMLVLKDASVDVSERLAVTTPAAGLWLLAASLRLREVSAIGIEEGARVAQRVDNMK
jgi:hypothetical protein